MNYKKGFTIIELIVVISIISVLSAIVISSVNGYLLKARDSRRKADLRTLAVALDMYYAQNSSYPTTGATGVPESARDGSHTPYSSNSGWQGFWDILKTNSILSTAPVDPKNHDYGPWCWSGSSTHNNIYTYASDGIHYILCSWLENESDPTRLGVIDTPNPWDLSNGLRANYGYSNFNYVIAK